MVRTRIILILLTKTLDITVTITYICGLLCLFCLFNCINFFLYAP